MRATGYTGPVRLVLFDVDGVLTDGRIFVDGTGEVVKVFNVKDGLAVSLLRAHGIRVGVLSGKSSAPLTFRISQLGFDVAVTGRLDKVHAYNEIKASEGVEDGQIVYVGDDVVDLALAGRVGTFVAPSDAHSMILSRADVVLGVAGGQGVAREVAEHILLADGLSLDDMYSPLLQGWDRFDAVQ